MRVPNIIVPACQDSGCAGTSKGILYLQISVGESCQLEQLAPPLH